MRSHNSQGSKAKSQEPKAKSVYFTDLSHDPQRFFEILPDDWQETIVPLWDEYKDATKIMALQQDDGKVVAGGLVFSTVSPDTLVYRQEAERWFAQGFLYFGFLWVREDQRGKGLGSLWLQDLHKHYPEQKFWLAIEELELCDFYIKNGYQLIGKVGGLDEWIMASHDLD